MNIAIITARGGSKGLPGKNIRNLNGLPLIGWTIKAAREAACIDRVYVTTEDQEISEISKSLGAEIIERPEELARDDTPSEPVIAHALMTLMDEGLEVENVFLLQPTSPLRTSVHIDQAWEKFCKTSSDCIISVFEPKHSPAKAYKVLPSGEITGLLHENAPYMRRQDLETCVQPNGAIYLFSARKFLEKNQIPRSRVYPLIMTSEESIDIDTIDDLELAETLMKKSHAS